MARQTSRVYLFALSSKHKTDVFITAWDGVHGKLICKIDAPFIYKAVVKMFRLIHIELNFNQLLM